MAFPADNGFIKLLTASDGSTVSLVTGFADASYTNLQRGKTITENISGPGTETINADGSVTVVVGGTARSSSSLPTRSGSDCPP